MKALPHLLKLAVPEDLEALMALFAAVRASLNQRGIQQWPESYPAKAQMLKDIQLQSNWVLRQNGQIAGTFTLNEDQDEEYKSIDWKYCGEKTMVLHRLAIHPNFQGQGWGRQLTQQALELAKAANADQMRLDTWSKNKVSTKLYGLLGFEQAAGMCYFHGHPEGFYCFEKKL